MAKYKVGDWLRVIGSKHTKFHVVEVLEQTCYAGTQLHYTGRVFVKDPDLRGWFPNKELGKFLEIELEVMKLPSLELVSMVGELKELRDFKEKLIKDQDFEAASKKRDEERALKDKIETQAMKEDVLYLTDLDL